MTIAIYPGTFDPITNGHTDLVQRAARLFEQVIVGVAANPGKKPCFPQAIRIELAEAALEGLDNVRVLGFDRLLVDFAREQQAGILLRGLRAVSDFEYEFQLANMNRHLAPDIETVFMTPSEQFAYISSSLVREVATHGGDVSGFVNEKVGAALLDRYCPY